MKFHRHFYQSTVLLTLAAIATGSGLATPVSANSLVPDSTTPNATANDAVLMAAALAGQCRSTNTPLGIFSGPAATSGTRVDVVGTGGVVRLADEGNGKGWIKVNYPREGFVSASGLVFLASCPPSVPNSGNPPTSNNDRCRRVSAPPEGLLIRQNASPGSASVGGVGVGETVTVTTLPPTTSKETSGRTWVQIAAPRAGWVSNGFTGANLVYCTSTPPTPTPPPQANRCRRVLRPEIGLLIQKGPNRTSGTVGGVAVNQQVRVTTDPATGSKDADGRVWVQIDQPLPGWVSNGIGPGGNLGYCQ